MDVFKWQSRAIASIACYTAYSFPSVFFSGLSYLFFYTVSSRYLYLSIGSISICPNENLDCSLVLPIVRDRFFSFPNLIWYFSAILSVTTISPCFSLGHNRPASFVMASDISIPRSFSYTSLFISSMRRAYCTTGNTPLCRMLSSILFPCWNMLFVGGCCEVFIQFFL